MGDGDGEVTEEELRKKYGTTIHVFDEEAARLAQLAKTAGIDGNMTAEELRRKFGSGEEDAAKIKELESKLKPADSGARCNSSDRPGT